MKLLPQFLLASYTRVPNTETHAFKEFIAPGAPTPVLPAYTANSIATGAGLNSINLTYGTIITAAVPPFWTDHDSAWEELYRLTRDHPSLTFAIFSVTSAYRQGANIS